MDAERLESTVFSNLKKEQQQTGEVLKELKRLVIENDILYRNFFDEFGTGKDN